MDVGTLAVTFDPAFSVIGFTVSANVWTNTGGTSATIAASTITDVAAPDNDVIEVTVTVTAGPAIQAFGRLVATKAP